VPELIVNGGIIEERMYVDRGQLQYRNDTAFNESQAYMKRRARKLKIRYLVAVILIIFLFIISRADWVFLIGLIGTTIIVGVTIQSTRKWSVLDHGIGLHEKGVDMASSGFRKVSRVFVPWEEAEVFFRDSNSFHIKLTNSKSNISCDSKLVDDQTLSMMMILKGASEVSGKKPELHVYSGAGISK